MRNEVTTMATRGKRTAAKHAKRRARPKIRTMDVILVIIAIALAAFTCEMIRLYRETGGIPDTLVVSFFSALGGECGAMAWIKNTKERRQDRKWQKQDEAAARRAAEKQEKEEHREV